MARLDADSICRVMGAAGSARNGRRRRPAATDGSVERARADCERSATAPSDIRRIAARLFAGQRYPGRHPHRCAPERVLDHMGGDIRGPYPRSGSTGSVRDAFTDRAYSSGAGARSRATGALGISAWHLAARGRNRHDTRIGFSLSHPPCEDCVPVVAEHARRERPNRWRTLHTIRAYGGRRRDDTEDRHQDAGPGLRNRL